jgi:hypothetical protein
MNSHNHKLNPRHQQLIVRIIMRHSGIIATPKAHRQVGAAGAAG